MITRISQKMYRETMKARKKNPKLKHGFLVFPAPDGRYYKCDKSGMQGAKEQAEWCKQIKDDMAAQTMLF